MRWAVGIFGLGCCLGLNIVHAQTNTPDNNIPSATKDTNEVTPLTLPGADSFVFKKVGETEVRLHVVKPKDWKATDKRACLVTFFGGGWSSGTPTKSISYAKWAAKYGLVGVAPDYRTRKRFDAKPEDCVADGRAAVRWIQESSYPTILKIRRIKSCVYPPCSTVQSAANNRYCSTANMVTALPRH